MGKYIGVDWASKGWFGVSIHDDGNWEADLYPSIWSLWKTHSDADRIFIDVPIGLPSVEQGRRECDVEAKRILGNRHRSVFYTPVRDAVYENNIDEAKTINEPAGFSIQNQAWSIVPRIREVDEFLDMFPGARDRFRETHPEVCFHGLNGGPLDHSKRTQAGVDERTALLETESEDATEIIESAVETFTNPAYAPLVSGPDDVLDALVVALTARRPTEDIATLPDVPQIDDRELPMEIVYPSAYEQTTLTGLEDTNGGKN